MTFRLITQDIFTGEFLNWDFPLSQVEITDTLSGPPIIKGVLEPEMPEINTDAYDSWATWLHAEQDGLIRASGIIQPASLDGEKLTIECEGVTGYPHGIPYLGEYVVTQKDPLQIVRDIWSHLQSYPDGNLGVTLDNTGSPKRLGTTKTESNPNSGPYTLVWWEHKDCGQEINALAKQTPFDYLETASWNADRTAVRHHIRIGYPRLGRRRTDLRFAQGENLVGEPIPLVESDDQWASAAIIIGAGEGRKTIRGTYSQRHPRRVRRVVVRSDKSLTSTDRANTSAAEEYRRRQAKLSFQQITIDARHPNAPLGSFSPGDDIPIVADFAYLGTLTIWHRITAVTWSPTAETATLQVAPSDSFSYGPPMEG